MRVLRSSRVWDALLLAAFVLLTLVTVTLYGELGFQVRHTSGTPPAANSQHVTFQPQSLSEDFGLPAAEPDDFEVVGKRRVVYQQAFIDPTTLSNTNAIFAGPWLFASGDLNIQNSTIVFKDEVQFFDTQQVITLDANSRWEFQGVVQIMVFTTWKGNGSVYFPPGSNLTVTTSNTLSVQLKSLFEGLIMIGNLRTKLEVLGPSINRGHILLVDRTSTYVCMTSTDLGRCRLENTWVESTAQDLTAWRIVEQLQVRGGIMELINCNITAQLGLPYELLYRETPVYNILDVQNVTRTAYLCGTNFGSTSFSDTTVVMIDTTCNYSKASAYADYSNPFQPSDGWILDWTTMIWANVTKGSRGLYITNGQFCIDGQSMYIDVKATGHESFSVPLMFYNASSCIMNWDIYTSIHNCPTWADCQVSGEDKGHGRCIYWFHYNDYSPSDASLWWLLLLLILPCCCCCCLLVHLFRKWRRYRADEKRRRVYDADLAYGKDEDLPAAVPIPALCRVDESGGCIVGEDKLTGLKGDFDDGYDDDDPGTFREPATSSALARPNTTIDADLLAPSSGAPPLQTTTANYKM